MEKDFTPEKIPYELILAEQEQTLSASEKDELERWKSYSENNKAIYEETLRLFQDTDLLAVREKVDVQKAWENFSTQLPEQKPVSKAKPAKTIRISKLWWSAAAMLLVGMGIIFVLRKNAYVDIHTGSAERKHFVFPDGSEAFLNQNTTLSYRPDQFSGSREIVFKKGEAYFNVKHNPKNPFHIRAEALRVEDLGTSFNLKITDQKISVAVSSGMVSLAKVSQSGEKILLKPNDKGVFDKADEKIIKTENELNNDKAWIDSTFNYQRTPLDQVAKEIAAVYGVKISFKNERLKKRRLTAFFKAKQIEQIMEIISKSLNITAVKSKEGYILSD